MQLFRLRINLDIIKEKIIMAKQGFAASDRRKVEVITTATHNVESHDCGTVFILAHATADADCDVTLPTIAQAGEGWWCKFVLSAVKSNGSEVSIDADGDTLELIVANGEWYAYAHSAT